MQARYFCQNSVTTKINMDEQVVINEDFWTINTFVFLDLETTGLIKEYEPLPRVTEIALVAISRENFLNSINDLPRVLHKLVMPINPNINIPAIVQHLTKLNSEVLKSETEFNNEAYVTFKHFIYRLKRPICLVSHNGNKFDFPILLNELQMVKQDFLTDLPDDLLCIDTLNGFKEILKSLRFSNSEDMDTSSESTSPCKQSNDHTYPKVCSTPIIHSLMENRTCKNISNSPRKLIDNHKLPTIYKYLFGCNSEHEHNAEGDCITLLKCCLKIKKQFICWADLHADLLKNYQMKHAILRNCY